MEIKYNIWHIDGYAGNNECDGPSDYNIHKDFILNDTYTKGDVVEIFCSQYKNKREVVVGKCFLVANGAATYKHNE